jgi:hypothetical protein
MMRGNKFGKRNSPFQVHLLDLMLMHVEYIMIYNEKIKVYYDKEEEVR